MRAIIVVQQEQSYPGFQILDRNPGMTTHPLLESQDESFSNAIALGTVAVGKDLGEIFILSQLREDFRFKVLSLIADQEF
jgi:hypothetical protein